MNVKHKRISILFVLVFTGVAVCLSACGMSEKDRQTYQEVLELALTEVDSENWQFTGQSYSWGMETANKKDQYNFYIDRELYDTYKHYWLEDVPREEYRESLNAYLGETGTPVQHCINIRKMNYENDSDYRGVQLKKNTDYYLARCYDRSVYYRCITGERKENEYTISDEFSLDHTSLSKKILDHKTDEMWCKEEIVRDD